MDIPGVANSFKSVLFGRPLAGLVVLFFAAPLLPTEFVSSLADVVNEGTTTQRVQFFLVFMGYSNVLGMAADGVLCKFEFRKPPSSRAGKLLERLVLSKVMFSFRSSFPEYSKIFAMAYVKMYGKTGLAIGDLSYDEMEVLGHATYSEADISKIASATAAGHACRSIGFGALVVSIVAMLQLMFAAPAASLLIMAIFGLVGAAMNLSWSKSAEEEAMRLRVVALARFLVQGDDVPWISRKASRDGEIEKIESKSNETLLEQA